MNRENWKTVKLGEISTQIRGVSYKPADVLDEKTENSATILRANNINEDKINYDELVFVKQQRVSDEQYLQKGDILICASSGSKHLVGKAACFNDDEKVTFGAFCKVVRPNGIGFEYLKHYFFSPTYRQIISSASEGANINNIRSEDLENLEIPLPPLDVQKQIALNLDQVTKVIAEHKELLAKYDLLIKSRFIEMFGDPVTNPMGWEVKKLGETGSCKNGMNFHYDENGVELNCLGVGDFKDYSIINECEKLPQVSLNELPSEEYLLKNEDLVFVRSNGNKDLVGRCVAVYPNELKTTFSGFCIRFRQESNLFVTDYLLRVLKTESMRKRMAGRGANIQNLNQQILTNLDIPVPPLELQQQFADFVQQIDKSKLVVQQSLEKAETLYKSLMQEYFG